MLLSLAGIPLTAGFLAKFYLVAAGADSHAWLLILVLVITGTIGLFYYLRVVAALFYQPVSEGPAPEPLPRLGSICPPGCAHGVGNSVWNLSLAGVRPDSICNRQHLMNRGF
ncbi:MAG TPA: proton-conducting transporter membrane subunit [Terracidiphilus sp.]|nr:proton-conducting transporter membrane subunit [Terracidiphilus sp.]